MGENGGQIFDKFELPKSRIPLQAFDNLLEQASQSDKRRIAQYFSYLVQLGEIEGLATRLLNNPSYSNLFNDVELNNIRKEAIPEEVVLPELLLNDDWGMDPVVYLRE